MTGVSFRAWRLFSLLSRFLLSYAVTVVVIGFGARVVRTVVLRLIPRDPLRDATSARLPGHGQPSRSCSAPTETGIHGKIRYSRLSTHRSATRFCRSFQRKGGSRTGRSWFLLATLSAAETSADPPGSWSWGAHHRCRIDQGQSTLVTRHDNPERYSVE